MSDTELLDWLESVGGQISYHMTARQWWVDYFDKGQFCSGEMRPTIREAIQAAKKGSFV